jgi:hypothetical protein
MKAIYDAAHALSDRLRATEDRDVLLWAHGWLTGAAESLRARLAEMGIDVPEAE